MSSILIKGSVMPLTCEECPCFDSNDYSCNVSGVDVAEYQYTGRPDNCPLVEVPTPHGRLIDAEVAETAYPLMKHQLMTIPTIIEAEGVNE